MPPQIERTQSLASTICERLAEGESLRSICRDPTMPGMTYICQWLDEDAEFAKQYARARELQADTKFEQAWEIAEAATPENAQVARLQVDTIKWQAGKLRPKVYGDKMDVNHDGGITIAIKDDY